MKTPSYYPIRLSIYAAAAISLVAASLTAGAQQGDGVNTTYRLDPAGSYLQAASPKDAPHAPLIINLSSIGIHPGDKVQLGRFGDMSFKCPDPSKTAACEAERLPDVCGVFSSSGTILDASNLHRVSGAIAPDFGVAQACVPEPEAPGIDIPEDFVFKGSPLQVPAGAQFLFVAVNDSFYSDNADPGNDLGIQVVKSLIVAPDLACANKNPNLPTCTANLLFGDGQDTTALLANIQPKQPITVHLATDAGSLSNGNHADTTTAGDGSSQIVFTAASVPVPANNTTSVAKITGTIGQPDRGELKFDRLSIDAKENLQPSLIFSYAGFNIHQSLVSDTDFVNANAMSADDIQAFLVNQNSFLQQLVIFGGSGGFIDTVGDKKLHAGDPVYIPSGPSQWCLAPPVPKSCTILCSLAACAALPHPVGSTGTRAADLIFSAASAQQINPKVLLATANKESAGIGRPKVTASSTAPPMAAGSDDGRSDSANTMNLFMGCGSPSDFADQFNCAARTFSHRFHDGQAFQYPHFLRVGGNPGITHFVADLHRNVPVGFLINSASIYPQYVYTPHTFTSLSGGVFAFEFWWKRFGF